MGNAMITDTNHELRLVALEHAVNGNDKPGLKVEMALVQKDAESLPDIRSRLARVEKTIWGAAGALGALEILLRIFGR